MDQASNILARLLVDRAKAGASPIKWSRDREAASFDPETHTITIPVIRGGLKEYTQRGYIFSNVCHLLTSNSGLWNLTRDLGVSPTIYSFVNQIRSERVLKDLYPGTLDDLGQFYMDVMSKSDAMKLSLKDSFMKKYYAHDKFGGTMARDVMDAHEKYLCTMMDRMETDDDFVNCCLEIQKMNDEEAQVGGGEEGDQNEDMTPEEAAQKQNSDHLNSQKQYTNQYIASGDDKDPLIKNFNPEYYAESLAKSHTIVPMRDCVMLHEVPYITEKLDDERLPAMVGAMRKMAEQLAAQFEVLKSAKSIANQRTSDANELDLNSLWEYRVSEEIWVEEIKQEEGKNHGIVILLDFSTSMIGEKLRTCIEQTLIMVNFCRMCSIPYQVYAFSKDRDDERRPDVGTFEGYIYSEPSIRLYNIFDWREDDMWTQAMEFILGVFYFSINKEKADLRTMFKFSSTPLFNSICAMPILLNDFVAQNKIEKVCLFVITDGCSDMLTYVKDGAFEWNDPDFKNKTFRILDEQTMRLYDENERGMMDMCKSYLPEATFFTYVALDEDVYNPSLPLLEANGYFKICGYPRTELDRFHANQLYDEFYTFVELKDQPHDGVFFQRLLSAQLNSLRRSTPGELYALESMGLRSKIAKSFGQIFLNIFA